MIDDDRLDAVLVSVGHHLDVSVGPAGAVSGDASPDLTASVAPGRRVPGARLLVAALVLVVVAGVVLAIAPARRTVGGWFGVGATEFRVDVDLAAPPDRLPSFVAGGEPITPSLASRLVGRPVAVLDESPLGTPVAWLAVPEGGAVAVWADDDTTLWMLPLGDVQEILFTKTVAMATQVRELPDLGDGGVVVDGGHLVATPYRSATAGSAVLWTSGDLSFRLESTGTGTGTGTGDGAAGTDGDLVALAEAIADVIDAGR